MNAHLDLGEVSGCVQEAIDAIRAGAPVESLLGTYGVAAATRGRRAEFDAVLAKNEIHGRAFNRQASEKPAQPDMGDRVAAILFPHRAKKAT